MAILADQTVRHLQDAAEIARKQGANGQVVINVNGEWYPVDMIYNDGDFVVIQADHKHPIPPEER